MNKDDLIYISLLIISIPIGFLFKNYIKCPQTKSFFSSIIGILMIIIVCPFDIWHSLILTTVNALIIHFNHPKKVAFLSFIWCFGYLLLFRMVHHFGISKPVPYANAVQLILTLKSVGLAFEVYDAFNRKKKLAELKKKNEENNLKLINKLELEIEFYSIKSAPSILQTFLYSYCHIGLLTGPYFKYRTYQDWLNSNIEPSKIDSISFIIERGRYVPLVIIGYLILSKFISFQDATKDEFYNSSFIYRLFYMAFIFTLFRFRFYIAWAFAEFSCISADFGVYPKVSKPKPGAGPTDLVELKKFYSESFNMSKNEDYNFETVWNINEYKTETALTVKEVLHYWNMSVQYWMASYVYKRVPLKQLGQPITMAVSAYWHGLHPGYYLSMLTTSPCILAENLMDKGFKRKYLSEKYYKYYDFCTWFFRTREFDYMSLGFILLTYNDTLRFWKSVYFIGHLACLFFIVLGYTLILIPKKSRNNRKAKKD